MALVGTSLLTVGLVAALAAGPSPEAPMSETDEALVGLPHTSNRGAYVMLTAGAVLAAGSTAAVAAMTILAVQCDFGCEEVIFVGLPAGPGMALSAGLVSGGAALLARHDGTVHPHSERKRKHARRWRVSGPITLGGGTALLFSGVGAHFGGCRGCGLMMIQTGGIVALVGLGGTVYGYVFRRRARRYGKLSLVPTFTPRFGGVTLSARL